MAADRAGALVRRDIARRSPRRRPGPRCSARRTAHSRPVPASAFSPVDDLPGHRPHRVLAALKPGPGCPVTKWPVALPVTGLSHPEPRIGHAARDWHRHRRLQQQRRLRTRHQARRQHRDRRLRIVADIGDVTPGASNAVHANFDGGRTDPISAATTRVSMPSDQTPHHLNPQAGRRSLPHRREHALHGNVDATDVRLAAGADVHPRATMHKNTVGRASDNVCRAISKMSSRPSSSSHCSPISVPRSA
jgi:hypothetical protein